MKKKYLWFIIPVMILAIVLTKFFLSDKVILVKPKVGPAVKAIYGMGIVRTFKKYDIKVGILTTVEKLYVNEGQLVKSGDPLIKFHNSGLLRAPFSGTVINTPYRDAEPVLPQTIVLSLADLTDLYLEVSLEQEGALKVKRGQKAQVTFEGYQGPSLRGEVEAIFPRSDEFIAHIKVPELPEGLMPGMTADVAIEIHRNPKAVMIPINAIVNDKVTILRNGNRIKETVKTGLAEGPLVEILQNSIGEDDLIEVRKKR